MSLRIQRIQRHRDLVEALRLPGRLYVVHPDWARRPPHVWALRVGGPIRSGRIVFFTAYRGSEVVGTLSVQLERDTAWFGHLQALDVPEVLPALWEAVDAQARQWGATSLKGPRDLSRFEYVGLTVEGHDRMAPLMQEHHGP